MNTAISNRLSTLLALVLLLGLLGLLIAGCGGGDPKAKPVETKPADVEINDSQNGRDVSVPVGQKLILTLDSNRTTGFAWSVKQDGSPVLITAGPSEYVAPPANSPPGKGSVEKFSFKAQSAGTQTLQLVYSRSFEPNNPPGNTFTVKVTVTK